MLFANIQMVRISYLLPVSLFLFLFTLLLLPSVSNAQETSEWAETKSKISLWLEPKIKSKKIGKLKKKTPVLIIDTRGKRWTRIKNAQNVEGWLPTRLLRKKDGAPPPSLAALLAPPPAPEPPPPPPPEPLPPPVFVTRPEPVTPAVPEPTPVEPVPAVKPKTDKREGIVVWRLEAKSGVTKKDIDSISGIITTEVENFSGRSATSEADVQTILKSEEVNQTCGNESTSCMAEIGAALGVPEVVSGDLGKMGDYWIINLRLLNVRTAKSVNRTSRRIKGGMNELIENLPVAVADLFGKNADAFVPAVGSSPKNTNTIRNAAIGTLVAGSVVAALGGVAHWRMDLAREDGLYGDSAAEGRHSTWKTATFAGYSVGGALLATSIALWITDAVQRKPASEKKVEVGFIPVENGFAASFQGRW